MYDVLLMVPLKAKLKILSVLCCQKGGTLNTLMHRDVISGYLNIQAILAIHVNQYSDYKMGAL